MPVTSQFRLWFGRLTLSGLHLLYSEPAILQDIVAWRGFPSGCRRQYSRGRKCSAVIVNASDIRPTYQFLATCTNYRRSSTPMFTQQSLLGYTSRSAPSPPPKNQSAHPSSTYLPSQGEMTGSVHALHSSPYKFAQFMRLVYVCALHLPVIHRV